MSPKTRAALSMSTVAMAVVFPAVLADAGPPSSACEAGLAPALAVPRGHALAFAMEADGVQIYSCSAPGGARPAWTLLAPDATLLDEHGLPAGKHGAGPTWEAADGSSVVGAKLQAASPDPDAIPWLLLRAASHAGRGRMADVSFVQRVRTSGGLAPAEGCSAPSVGTVARVPYRAVYCFYRGAQR